MYSMTPTAVRRTAAVLVALTGMMNVVSAVTPAMRARLELLQDVVSLDVIHRSQTATVLAGFLLILLADGLRKRRAQALRFTIGLLLLSSVLHLAKGLDVEEASLAGLLALWLVANRRVFTIPAIPLTPARVLEHLSEAFLLYWGYVLLGFFLLQRAVRPAPRLEDVLAEPFRLVAGVPHFTYLTAQGHWFQDSLTVIACLFVLYCVVLALRPYVPLQGATAHDRERAREIIRRHGTDTLSYFALQDGRRYFFHDSGAAFLSYRLWDNVALVAGDPIGDSGCFPELVREFLGMSDAMGLDPCFLGTGDEHLGLYRRLGLRTLKIGEEALIDLPTFDSASLKRKVRRAARHIGEMGIQAVTYRAGEVPPELARQAEEIDTRWLRLKGGVQRGFSMTLGRFPRPEDADCEVTFALRDGAVLGFVSVVPVYGARSWSLDAMRRLPDCPNGLMEFLVIAAAEGYRNRGYRTLSLNFASLANSMDDIDSRMLEETRRFLFDNLSGLYQLKSLAQFNGKFAPCWHGRYLAYRDVLAFPKLVLAVVQAEDPIRVPRLLSGRR